MEEEELQAAEPGAMIGIFRKKAGTEASITDRLVSDARSDADALASLSGKFEAPSGAAVAALAERKAKEREATRSKAQRTAAKARRKDPNEVRNVQMNLKVSANEKARAIRLQEQLGVSMADVLDKALDLLEAQMRTKGRGR